MRLQEPTRSNQDLAQAATSWKVFAGGGYLQAKLDPLGQYLQPLAARDNIQICQPSTAAQYLHLLRRQALGSWRKPLIVFTPKSMLRHPDAASRLDDFAAPRFQKVLPETEIKNPKRLLFCTGKIGHELRTERTRREQTNTGILFIEQLYPWPADEIAAALDCYPNAHEMVWVQEEPANMGALSFVVPRLRRLARGTPGALCETIGGGQSRYRFGQGARSRTKDTTGRKLWWRVQAIIMIRCERIHVSGGGRRLRSS